MVLDLGRERFVYEDSRYFGRLTLDTRALSRMGPEPLSDDFTSATFGAALARSRQAIKVKLLDQSLVAGVGNIYASEALFRARIAPQLAARKLSLAAGESPPAHDPPSAGLRQFALAAPFPCITAKNGAATGCFILGGRRVRPIIMRNACGFMTGKDCPARAVGPRSGASSRPPGARFIVRFASRRGWIKPKAG